MDDAFNPNGFYSQFNNVLIKGEEENGEWIVYLQASNELKDQDNETIEMDALKKSAEYYMKHGILSWDHKHKMTHDPRFIIGEPLDVRFTADKKTLVKGFLYKSNDIAQSVWKNIKSNAKKMGASVGGGILQKANSVIKKVVWDETAITHKPVNDGTFGTVQIVPFMAFAKALMAGSGVDAGSFTGGRALTPESLQGNMATRESLKVMFHDLMIAVKAGRINSYNDMLNFVYDRGYEGNEAATIVNYIARKVPNVVRSGQ
jgi:hypothetical protein